MSATATVLPETTWATCPAWCDPTKCSGPIDERHEPDGYLWIHHQRQLPFSGSGALAIQLDEYAYSDGDRSVLLAQHGDALSRSNAVEFRKLTSEARRLLEEGGHPFSVEYMAPTRWARVSEDEARRNIGQMFRTMREGAGLSIDEAAGLVVMTPEQWAAVETGDHALDEATRTRIIPLFLKVA